MRELTFAIEFNPGSDPLMDIFIDHPSIVSHALGGPVSEGGFWRIERVSGPEAALNQIEDTRFDKTCCCESVTEKPCKATWYHDTLDRSANELVLYTYLEDVQKCESIHTLAGKHLPPGLIFKTHRRKSTHWWRILMQSEEKIGVFYDALRSRLRDGLSFRIGHLCDASDWRQESPYPVALPEEQEQALRAAVSAGYYEPPRETTLDDIAAELDIPRSTLSYRLRQAESKLIRRYINGDESARWLE